MKVFRGPRSIAFWDWTHEEVARIEPKQLEEGVGVKGVIQFNITKDRTERGAVCTMIFEDEDLIPMASGLVARLKRQKECLTKIKEIMADKNANNDQKAASIQAALKPIWFVYYPGR